MSGLYSELEADARALDVGCQTTIGVTGAMYRTAKYVFYIATLGMATYLIQYADVEPFIAMAFAALLITGPEGLEAWLIKIGRLEGDRGDPKNRNQ